MTERLIVGVDGSPNGREALAVAARLAGRLHCEVVAVHAVGLLAHVGGGAEPARDHLADIERALRDEWCRPLAEAGVTYRTHLVQGDSVDVLVAAATREQAVLCVVGRRGHRPHPELVLGSTSLQLIQTAGFPVLVVPPDDADDRAGGRDLRP